MGGIGLRAEYGNVRSLFGGAHVVLHQNGRKREHIADVIEAVAGIVLGKIVGGLIADAEEVAERVVIFGTVQAAGSYSPRVDRLSGQETAERKQGP